MSGTILLFLRILLTLSLYAFLGWAMWTLWRELRQESHLRAEQHKPTLGLRLLAPTSGQMMGFNSAVVTVGRDPRCDVILDDATVSAQHARFSFHHDQWWLEDLRATNGTYLNQERVIDPLVVTSGDQVQCGQVILSITIENGRQDAT